MLYALASVAGAFVYGVLNISEHLSLALFSVALALLFVVLLLHGSRVAWTFVVAATAIDLLISPFATQPWWNIAIEILSLALLLAPASRSFVWRSRPVQAGPPTQAEKRAVQTTWDPDRHPDSDRPAGWYLDPDSPGRMRSWNAHDARWSGTIRTPRKIRRDPSVLSAARRAR